MEFGMYRSIYVIIYDIVEQVVTGGVLLSPIVVDEDFLVFHSIISAWHFPIIYIIIVSSLVVLV